MLFITFQPKIAKERLLQNEIYTPIKNENLEYDFSNEGIFCLKVDETTRARLFLTGPSMPQVGVIFETDKFTEIDTINRANKLAFGDAVEEIQSEFKEYIVPKIIPYQVKEIIDISDSDDANEAVEAYFNKDFYTLDKLSGKAWRHLEVIIANNVFRSGYELRCFMNCMSNCISPELEVLTEDHYKEALSLIYQYLASDTCGECVSTNISGKESLQTMNCFSYL